MPTASTFMLGLFHPGDIDTFFQASGLDDDW